MLKGGELIKVLQSIERKVPYLLSNENLSGSGGVALLSKNPLETIGLEKLSASGVAQALRLAIIGELDAINLYVQLADAIDDERVRRVLLDIAYEEKVHVGELMEILEMIDPEQARAVEKASREIKELIK